MRYSSLSGLAATVPRRVNGRSIAIGALMLALVALTAACGSSGGDPTQASAVESTVALPQNHGLVVLVASRISRIPRKPRLTQES